MSPDEGYTLEQACPDGETAPPAESVDLSEFFGGAWDFCPNGTFSDLSDGRVPSQFAFSRSPPCTTTENNSNNPPSGTETAPAAINAPSTTTSRPSASPPNKSKPPNLYEFLRRPQMMPTPTMMAMSPLGNYVDNSFYGGTAAGTGLDWMQALDPSVLSNNGIMPPSPQMMVDPHQYNFMVLQASRMKRPRVSPYLGTAALDPATFGFGGMGLGVGNFPGMTRMARPAKMPLSPMHRVERNASEASEATAAKTMPLVLPFSANTGMAKASTSKPVTPVKLMPAKPIVERGSSSKPIPPLTETPTIQQDDNLQLNLRSFLRDTRDLEWDNVTVVELKRILRKYDLNATGKKSELMQRIKKIRHMFRDYEEDPIPSTKIFTASPAQSGGTGKPAESSPDTMGSERGLESTPNSTLSVDALDSLFAGALDIPTGHQELLFTPSTSS